VSHDIVERMTDKANDIGAALDRYRDAARPSIKEIALRTTVAGIPYAGGPILEIINGLAKRRVEERLDVVFAAMKQQLELMSKEKVNQEFFGSEEFQSLFYLLLERLHASHHEEKLKTFGHALGNSASADFQEDDKEQYIRILRDLSLEDLQTLQKLAKIQELPSHMRAAALVTSENPSVARMVGLGLIHETVQLRDFNLSIPVVPTSSQSIDGYARGLAKAFQEYFKKAPVATYRLSSFGKLFLDFIASSNTEATPDV
jgi:hypothetical protein